MPSSQSNLTRSHLTMDEQSFQSLLSAAFTIQEHNARQRQEPELAESTADVFAEPQVLCQHCGAEKASEESRCEACDLGEFRPGERMQRNWASMWLMSQEQGLWPERSTDRELSASNFLAAPMARQVPAEQLSEQQIAPAGAKAPNLTNKLDALETPVKAPVGAPVNMDFASAGLIAENRSRNSEDANNKSWEPVQEAFSLEGPSREDLIAAELVKANRQDNHFASKALVKGDHDAAEGKAHTRDKRRDTLLTIVESLPMQLVEGEQITEEAEGIAGQPSHAIVSEHTALSPGAHDFRISNLTWFRSITMLQQHRADLYLGASIFVAVLALLWPAANPAKRSEFSLWDRALIGIGVAEAPTPIAHLPGDPGVQVWIDPHTALYYCQGDDLYGKAANGRFSTQREAQMERFEPATRNACE